MSLLRIVVLFPVSLLYRSSVAWDYRHNGADWGSLGQCGTGNAGTPQSPIDIPDSISEIGASTVFLKYPEITSSLTLYNNGYSIAFTLPSSYKGGFGLGTEADDFKQDGASAYRLWQVNFHAPSEHTFEGKKMPLEMQLMHQRVTGGGPETAVVVVSFADAANVYHDFLDAFAQQLPDSAWKEAQVTPPAIPFASLIGGSPFYHYEGSLTVPPCASNVKYYVRQAPVNAANAQLVKFADALAKSCPPKGNFRILQPMHASIVLMASVDLVTNPSVTVKPHAPSESDAKAAGGSSGGGCLRTEYDDYWSERGRIAVGDPDYLVKAKTNYIAAKRSLQAAESSYRSSERNADMQEGLYNNAPGLVEKINLKWNVDNAKKIAAQAKVNADGMDDTVKGPLAELVAAFDRYCDEKREAAAKKAPAATAPTPAPAPETPVIYPEPHVTLPTGLSASPFNDNADKSDPGVKIAPNLQQADVPTSSTIQSAEAKSGMHVVTAKSSAPTQKLVKINLPISRQNLVDENKFKSDLLDALAKTAKVPPSDLSVQGIKDESVANVQPPPPPPQALFQLQTKRSFLHSDPS